MTSLLKGAAFAGAVFMAGAALTPATAQSVMQQCGQQYQAAKSNSTLNGMSWKQYRTECAARLKATPAAQTEAAPAVTPAAAPANPLKPTPTAATPVPAPTPAPGSAAIAPPETTPAATKPMSAGRTAFVARERQCGAEWKTNKATLVAQTPGLKWPKYLSQCNARLKAAGQ